MGKNLDNFGRQCRFYRNKVMSYLALIESFISEAEEKKVDSTINFIAGLENYLPYDINDKYDTRELIKRYMELCFWFSANLDNSVLKEEEITVALNEIEILEDELVSSGTSEEVLDRALKITSGLANKKLNELTDGQQLKLIQAIFGEVKEVPPLSKA